MFFSQVLSLLPWILLWQTGSTGWSKFVKSSFHTASPWLHGMGLKVETHDCSVWGAILSVAKEVFPGELFVETKVYNWEFEEDPFVCMLMTPIWCYCHFSLGFQVVANLYFQDAIFSVIWHILCFALFHFSWPKYIELCFPGEGAALRFVESRATRRWRSWPGWRGWRAWARARTPCSRSAIRTRWPF